jgi:hypothetical protein
LANIPLISVADCSLANSSTPIFAASFSAASSAKAIALLLSSFSSVLKSANFGQNILLMNCQFNFPARSFWNKPYIILFSSSDVISTSST